MTTEIRAIKLDEAELLYLFNKSIKSNTDSYQSNIDTSMGQNIRRSFENQYLSNPYFNRKCDSSNFGAFVDGKLCGTLAVYPQPLHINNNIIDFAWLQGWYIDESRRRGGLGLLLLYEVQKHYSNIGTLGIGGPTSNVFKLYRALKWEHHGEIPFFFQIVNPKAFLEKFKYLHKNKYLEFVCKMASSSIIIPLGIKFYFDWKGASRKRLLYKRCQIEPQESFWEWSDKIWIQSKVHYGAVLERKSTFLNWRFATEKEYKIYKIAIPDKGEGYFVVKVRRMVDDPRFGSLLVGTVVDYFCCPKDTEYVLASAATILEEMGSELIVCNFSHKSAVRALPKLGFFSATSNYSFVSSNKWRSNYKPGKVPLDEWHLSRGDSDGDRRI